LKPLEAGVGEPSPGSSPEARGVEPAPGQYAAGAVVPLEGGWHEGERRTAGWRLSLHVEKPPAAEGSKVGIGSRARDCKRNILTGPIFPPTYMCVGV
jgi:hypothetical protein